MTRKNKRSESPQISTKKMVVVTNPIIKGDLVVTSDSHNVANLNFKEILTRSNSHCEYVRRKIGKKYREELYAPRSVDNEVYNWFTSKSSKRNQGWIITERAGSGKTNLLCHMSEIITHAAYPCVFILGSDPISDKNSLLFEIFQVIGLNRDDLDLAQKQLTSISEDLTLRPLIILIDAINEARDIESFKGALLELLAFFSEIPTRVLVTCRDIYWAFMEGEWADVINFSMPILDMYHYDPHAWEIAREKYFDAYRIKGKLLEDADEKCRHPLLFKFFCETYEGEDVSTVRDIRLRPLFEMYIEKKAQKISRKLPSMLHAHDKIERVLTRLSGDILKTRQLSVPEDRIPVLTGEKNYLLKSSIYVCLLDEDIMIEEVPDKSTKHLSRRVRFVYEAFLEFMIALRLEREWNPLSNDQIIDRLSDLLEPNACLRNVMGALRFMLNFFSKRKILYWESFSRRGPQWSSIALQSLAELPPFEAGSLEREGFKILFKKSDVNTRVRAMEILCSQDRRETLDPHYEMMLWTIEKDAHQEVRLAALKALHSSWDNLSFSLKLRFLTRILDRAKAVRKFVSVISSDLDFQLKNALYKILVDGLTSDNKRIRSYAVHNLDLKVWPEAEEHLIHSLEDEYSWVRSASLINLKNHPNERHIGHISRLLSDPISRVRSLAAIVCEHWRFNKSIPTLLERIEKEKNPIVLSRITDAIGYIGSKDAETALSKLVFHDDYWVCMRAGAALTSLQGLRCIPLLMKASLKRKDNFFWPKTWPDYKMLEGLTNLRELCKIAFGTILFEAKVGSFFVGLNIAEVALQRNENKYSELGWDQSLVEWIAAFLADTQNPLQFYMLKGMCLSYASANIHFVRLKPIEKALFQQIKSGNIVLAALAAQYLIKYGSELDSDHVDRIMSSTSSEAKVLVAWGLVKYFDWKGDRARDIRNR